MSKGVCCIPGCCVTNKDVENTLHRFPCPDNEAKRFAAWISNIGGDLATLDVKYVHKNRRVCRRHFEEVYLYPGKKLCRAAIPRLHLLERVTTAQTDVLCSFFEENPEVLRGYKKTPQCKDAVQRKWTQITPQLNSLGPSRDSRSWAKYLCDVKAKLKRKQVKWKQKSDGTGPIICNADDFSEIALRMFQILRQDTTSQPDAHESTTSDLEMEEDPSPEDDATPEIENESSGLVDIPLDKRKDKKYQGRAYINLISNTSQPSEIPSEVFLKNEFNDEFDTFGKNIAQQLRTLPLSVALESQEMLLSVMRKQRLKVLYENTSSDPLDKPR